MNQIGLRLEFISETLVISATPSIFCSGRNMRRMCQCSPNIEMLPENEKKALQKKKKKILENQNNKIE